MQPTLRNEFLKNKWRKYPSITTYLQHQLDEGQAICGRVLQISAPQSLQILSEDMYVDVDMRALTDQLDVAREITSILREGDVVFLAGELQEHPRYRGDGQRGYIEAKGIELLTANVLESRPATLSTKMTFARSYEWSLFTQLIRQFFSEMNFIEARTPSLVANPGTEPTLDVFSTEFRMGSRMRKYYLPTSPELHLKKMLAMGWPRIFELKECFRNGEISKHHQPEFMMLEWYRAFSNLDTILHDCFRLLQFLGEKWEFVTKQKVQGLNELEIVTVAELWKRHCDFYLTPTTSKDELIALAKRFQITTALDDSWDDIYFRIFIDKIEPQIGREGPVFVRDYPPSQSALARINDNGWADRFELYWRGLEIANAFHELNDPFEQRERLERDRLEKQRLGKEPLPVDKGFLDALDYGMPPSGGIALGVERLFMAVTGVENLDQARVFTIDAEQIE